MKIVFKKFIAGACCSAALVWSAQIAAANGFVVKGIDVTGLQRVKKGTVLNYMPVQVGEEVGPESTAKIIRALYETGFFQSVALERKGNILIVRVVERSTIGSINVSGNNEIPKDKLNELLKQLGLVQGRVFQRQALERLKKELKQAYNARGKYNARINSSVSTLTDNRVALNVTVSEGRVSRIKEIKILGNKDFSDKELRSELSLTSSGLLTYVTKKDQYTKESMDASLEALRSFYLDRGYLKFNIISSQVMLSPDKKDVFINIHIEEGPQYRFAGYDVLGKTDLSKEKVASLIQVKKGEVFSRKKVTESISAIGLALGDKGYGFPAVNAEPRLNEKEKTVFVMFVVQPGRHVYVRRINFHGNVKTADYVLRNVIRQDEAALLTIHSIKESERQLRLLGYLKNVDIKTNPVPGTNNQVDLDVKIEEAPSAEASASLGYGTNGPQVNASFNQHNFMGTGRSVGLAFNASYWGQNYSYNYYNPFYAKGVGRGLNLYYRRVSPNEELDVSTYTSNSFGGDINYNFLLNEKSSAQLSFGYQDLNIKTIGSSTQVKTFVDLNGDRFRQIRLSAGWNRNSYDRMPYPVRGVNQQANALLALPADSHSLTYYKTSYQAHMYYPLTRGFIFTLLGNIAYGNTFDNQGLPFYENYMAGGIAQPGQVRGYDSFSLGPQDSFGNAIGANFLVNGSVGLVLPYPLSRETIRTTAFVDAGNVFAKGTPDILRGTSAGSMRYSAGLSLEWRSPFGPLAFSLATPLNKQPGDVSQVFQFAMSSSF